MVFIYLKINILLSKENYEDCPGRNKCNENGAYRGIIFAAQLNNWKLVSAIFFSH